MGKRAATRKVNPAVPKLIEAIKSGDAEEVTRIVRECAKANETTTSALVDTLIDADGMPLLHHAARYESSEVLDALKELGCSVSCLDGRGGTAVLEAADAGSLLALKWLEEKGVVGGVFRPDARGDTALHMACGKGRAHVLDWLLEKGADIGAQSVDLKARPLTYAVAYNQKECVQWLIAHGADLSPCDMQLNWTYMHIAAANGHEEMCEILASHYPALLDMPAGKGPFEGMLPERVAMIVEPPYPRMSPKLKALRRQYSTNIDIEAEERRASEAARALMEELEREERNQVKKQAKKAKKKAKKRAKAEAEATAKTSLKGSASGGRDVQKGHDDVAPASASSSATAGATSKSAKLSPNMSGQHQQQDDDDEGEEDQIEQVQKKTKKKKKKKKNKKKKKKNVETDSNETPQASSQVTRRNSDSAMDLSDRKEDASATALARTPPSSPHRPSRIDSSRAMNRRMNPRAPSWSPGKRRWTAGTLGEKSRKEAAAAAANLEHRLEREAESSNERTNTAKSAKSEFDRLLKRFVHMDPTARRTARRRFAKQMLQGQDAQSDGKNTMYTLYFPKAKEAAVQTDDRETSSEKVVVSSASRTKSWADEVEEEEEEEEEEGGGGGGGGGGKGRGEGNWKRAPGCRAHI